MNFFLSGEFCNLDASLDLNKKYVFELYDTDLISEIKKIRISARLRTDLEDYMILHAYDKYGLFW